MHATLYDDVFITRLNLEATKEARDKLEEEFRGCERTKIIQFLDLRRVESIKICKKVKLLKEFSKI